uniref:Uncharacterized protein n=1 Tax=Arundo donax TaxID=35708 RepID=A0A0A9FR21_ARUDO
MRVRRRAQCSAAATSLPSRATLRPWRRQRLGLG